MLNFEIAESAERDNSGGVRATPVRRSSPTPYRARKNPAGAVGLLRSIPAVDAGRGRGRSGCGRLFRRYLPGAVSRRAIVPAVDLSALRLIVPAVSVGIYSAVSAPDPCGGILSALYSLTCSGGISRLFPAAFCILRWIDTAHIALFCIL